MQPFSKWPPEILVEILKFSFLTEICHVVPHFEGFYIRNSFLKSNKRFDEKIQDGGL